jgi:F-box protein 18 (helicase)
MTVQKGMAPVQMEQTGDGGDVRSVFVPIRLGHGDRVDWARATHVRLLNRSADTPKAQESLDFITTLAREAGIAAIADLEPEFPGRLRSTKGQKGAMRFDLRHFANSRDSGNNSQDKGLIELGYLATANTIRTCKDINVPQSSSPPDHEGLVKLTEEQKKIVDSQSESLKVVAFAGAGKTSTLLAYALARPKWSFLYLAFNRSVSLEASEKFPRNVKCITTHALAYRAIGRKFSHKLEKGNLRATLAAAVLGLNHEVNNLIHANKSLKAMQHFMASSCISFKEFSSQYEMEHSTSTLSSAEVLWNAMIDINRLDMPMTHDGYLKLYQTSNPILDYDCILFDEAQDANPVTLEIVNHQACKKVFVGDPHQQIYQFRRAINAMEDPSLRDTLYLTESFRFGYEVEQLANNLLALKRESKSIKGARKIPSTETKAYLSRGNAKAFARAFMLAKNGKRTFFVGGVNGYRLDLLSDIWNLKSKNTHAIKNGFIRSFNKYESLTEYAEAQNELDLLSWINYLERHRSWRDIPDEIVAVRAYATDRQIDGELAVSTAHKSKGLEFGVVELADDFPSATLIELPENTEPKRLMTWQYGPIHCPCLWDGERFKGGIIFPVEEINLLYVAITRAESKVLSPPPIEAILNYLKRFPDFLLVDNALEPSQKVKKIPLDYIREPTIPAITDDKIVEKPSPLTSQVLGGRWWDILKFITGRKVSKPNKKTPTITIDDTLPDLVLKEFSIKPTGKLDRFKSSGWFFVGETNSSCPSCGLKSLYGYRKPYKTKKGDTYHYWALLCLPCKTIFAPDDLGVDSRKALKNMAIPIIPPQKNS